MEMGKICFLLDPDKKEVENVFNACVRLQNKLDRRFLKNFVEYWVGGTKATGYDVKRILEKLKASGIGPRIIFPGKITQGTLGYQYADITLVPYLLNWTYIKVFVYNLVGIVISTFYKRKQSFGYLVMSNNSSAGREIGARNLTHKDAIRLVKSFIGKNKIIYIEAGSGAKKPIDVKLVNDVSRIVAVNQAELIVGGGIKNSNEIKKLFSIGVNKVVVGTVLEQESVEKSLRVLLSILTPFESIWKRRNYKH